MIYIIKNNYRDCILMVDASSKRKAQSKAYNYFKYMNSDDRLDDNRVIQSMSELLKDIKKRDIQIFY